MALVQRWRYCSELFHFTVILIGVIVWCHFMYQGKFMPSKTAFAERTTPTPQRMRYGQLEIQLRERALLAEGIGAVAQGLKPVLLLANATYATVTAKSIASGHRYQLADYFHLRPFLPRQRVVCPASRNITKILNAIIEQCEKFPFNELPKLFTNCNTIVVTKYLGHPRSCVSYTAHLVRKFSKFREIRSPKEDVCFLRRGGDVEKKILTGKYNLWALDTGRLKPILAELRRRKVRIVVITETSEEPVVRRYYQPDILSNKEALPRVVSRLMKCRCLFLSSASSFAVTMAQISRPTHLIYTKNHSAFPMSVKPYVYEEWNKRAHSMLEEPTKLADFCFRETRRWCEKVWFFKRCEKRPLLNYNRSQK